MKTRVTLEFDRSVFMKLMNFDKTKTIRAMGEAIYDWLANCKTNVISTETKVVIDLLNLDIKSEVIKEESDV